MRDLAERTGCVVIGGGIAGAASAWALARAGLTAGVILEREALPGAYASGRNAALAYQVESDPVILALALRSIGGIRGLERGLGELVRPTGSLTVASRDAAPSLVHRHETCRRAGLPTTLLRAPEARARFPLLERVRFEIALWCPSDGVIDIHALLMRYLELADGFTLHTNWPVEELLVEAGRVAGVRSGPSEVRADLVVDACGAWAGALSRAQSPLPVQPLRRHLFISGPLRYVARDWPFTWVLDEPLYFRPEGEGLLLSPCDETPSVPGQPAVDPDAALLLADKLARRAPGLGDLPVRRVWACLRTFAPDRRPIIGADPVLPGLFHASALGGIGMTASAAVGELLACVAAGARPDWIKPALVAPARFKPVEELPCPTAALGRSGSA